MEQPNTQQQVMESVGKTAAIVFSFDTTGSMQPCIAEVRLKLKALVEEMFGSIPDLRIGVIAHGDYSDGDNCIKTLDLTHDLVAVMDFINDAPNTSGGDAPECYELALNAARKMSWPEEGGSVVLIGDATPHPPEENPDHLDWKQELAELQKQNVQVVPLQCLRQHNYGFNNFWPEVATLSETPLLFLDTFEEASLTLGSVAAATAGEDVLRDYVASQGEVSCNVVDNFEKMSTYASQRATKAYTKSSISSSD